MGRLRRFEATGEKFFESIVIFKQQFSGHREASCRITFRLARCDEVVIGIGGQRGADELAQQRFVLFNPLFRRALEIVAREQEARAVSEKRVETDSSRLRSFERAELVGDTRRRDFADDITGRPRLAASVPDGEDVTGIDEIGFTSMDRFIAMMVAEGIIIESEFGDDRCEELFSVAMAEKNVRIRVVPDRGKRELFLQSGLVRFTT